MKVSLAKPLIKPNAYPDPPLNTVLTPNVETMYYRYLDYCNGKEPLASMASFCLTVFEASTGRKKGQRRHAAKMYRIEKQVLDKIGDLTTNKGGATVRKAAGVETEFSPQECQFSQHAVRTIIRRMAQYAHPSANQFGKDFFIRPSTDKECRKQISKSTSCSPVILVLLEHQFL